MEVVAIDPGNELSALVRWDGEKIHQAVKLHNFDILHYVGGLQDQTLAIEMIASYGMAVGKEVFETCVWIGRYTERYESGNIDFLKAQFVYRKDVKMHLCGSMRAKDGNIRQALIDRIGPQGTKKKPGPTYGISGDMWQALAVAVTYYDLNCKKEE